MGKVGPNHEGLVCGGHAELLGGGHRTLNAGQVAPREERVAARQRAGTVPFTVVVVKVDQLVPSFMRAVQRRVEIILYDDRNEPVGAGNDVPDDEDDEQHVEDCGH